MNASSVNHPIRVKTFASKYFLEGVEFFAKVSPVSDRISKDADRFDGLLLAHFRERHSFTTSVMPVTILRTSRSVL
jgi:hypothetical protein